MPMEKMQQVKVAKQLRADDIRVGEYVAVLCETYEWPAVFCSGVFDAPTVHRATLVPNHTEDPVRIEAVCVPFVFVVDTAGKHRVLDLRRVRLARVSGGFGRAVFAAKRTTPKRCKKCAGAR